MCFNEYSVLSECLGHFLRLVNQQIPPALRNAPLGFRLSLLDHCHQHFDKGLKVHLRDPGNCLGPLLDRRRKGGDVNVCYRGGYHVDKALAGVGNKPGRMGNFAGQHRQNKETTSKNKHGCCPCFLPRPDLPFRGIHREGACFYAGGVFHAPELAAHSAPRRLPSERARRWPSEHARQWTSERARWRHSSLPPRAWELHPLEVLLLPDYLLCLLLSYKGRLLFLLRTIPLRLLQSCGPSRW